MSHDMRMKSMFQVRYLMSSLTDYPMSLLDIGV
jgi:hypothetical protein